MKYFLPFIFILKISFLLAQDAPAKLGAYVVGQTTYVDFITLNGYTGNDRNIIKTNKDLINAKVSADEDYFLYTNIYKLIPYYTKEIPTNQNMILSNDSTVSFFINQMNFDTYCVNNIFLNFFNDTLVSISFDGAEKVKNILLDKYKRKGTLGKSEFSKSFCKRKDKNGKPIRDERMLLTFFEKESDIFTVLSLFLNFSSNCEFYQYINIRIFAFSKYESVYKYALYWKKQNEYLYYDEKMEIKGKEKGNAKRVHYLKLRNMIKYLFLNDLFT